MMELIEIECSHCKYKNKVFKITWGRYYCNYCKIKFE